MRYDPGDLEESDADTVRREGNDLTSMASEAESDDEVKSYIDRGFALIRIADRIEKHLGIGPKPLKPQTQP
jgi:hypothetical protein